MLQIPKEGNSLCKNEVEVVLQIENYQLFKNYRDVVTVQQMSEMLNISKSMAYLLINQKKIHCLRVGNRIRIPKYSVIAYIENNLKRI